MTIETNDTVERYDVNGTGPYAFSFRIFDENDLTVSIIEDSTGDAAELTLDTHYTVAGINDEDGGTVTLVSATATQYASGYTLDIRSNVPLEQPTGLENQGAFRLQAIEGALDRQSRQLQDLNRIIRNCLKIPDNENFPNTTFPALSGREGLFWTFGANGELESATPVDTPLTSSLIGTTLNSLKRTPAEIAAGVTPTDYAYRPLDVRRYGAVGDDSTDCYTAITAAISIARQMGGGEVLLPESYAVQSVTVYAISAQLLLYEGVHLVGVASAGGAAKGVGIRYTGTAFVDVIATASSSDDDNIAIKNLIVWGGQFQAGKARYCFYAEQFHRGCEIVNCQFRDAYGLIKIVSGYYSKVHHNIFQRVTPEQGALSDANWNEIYSGTSAPVFLGEMNGADCQHNILATLTGDEAGGAAPTQAIWVTGQNVDCRGWIIESTGVDVDAYQPRVDHLIRTNGYCNYSGLYVEACDVDDSLILAVGEAVTVIEGFSMYDCAGLTVFNNQAMGDMSVRSGLCYRMNFNRVWSVAGTGISVGGEVIFEDVRWRSGERVSDASINADADNVYDTADTGYSYGAIDGTELRFHRQRVCFPRAVTGLAVTNSSDVEGEYIDVTGGVLLSERGTYINSKMRTASSLSGNISRQRLRPTVVSKNYRVYVGKAGNIHLVESASAFTDPTGDWLASFVTDGSGVIGSLTANPRLSQKGNFLTGTDIAINHPAIVFGAADTTPSVAYGTTFETGGALTLTALDDGVSGQKIVIFIKHATTFDCTGTSLKGPSGADITAAAGDLVRGEFDGTNWYLTFHDLTV